jgi:hypothetical protein
VEYTSEIIDGGKIPLFQVTPSDNPSLVLQHNTSSGVWVEMLKLIKKRPNVSVSGPEVRLQIDDWKCSFDSLDVWI